MVLDAVVGSLEWWQLLIAVISGLMGLIGTGIGIFFSIKTIVKQMKEKTFSENWELIKTMATSAMTEAEKSKKSGADKKQMVIDAVTAGAKAAGIDISAFMTQLSAFIDNSIAFANTIK
jgi:uncharacterized protein YneF (UPF0154 family)